MNVFAKLIIQLFLILGIGNPDGFAAEPMTINQKKANQLSLISCAFFDLGFNVHEVHFSNSEFFDNNEIDICTTVPDGFFKFVKTKEEIPQQNTKPVWGWYIPQENHCDFSCGYTWDDYKKNLSKNFLLNQNIVYGADTSMHTPDITIRLLGLINKEQKQILVTLDRAIFRIEINRKEDLKQGLKDFVTIGMKDGIYVVVPDDVLQVDWKTCDLSQYQKSKKIIKISQL